ncbi:GNAT family N-acetyltransferase [Neotamlana laminarinivorans]|uniref:GNAT family N-acetyltransferase n=1 Tax=Neotamlana laminarinivorans TaxID=2883124 RepID=A0A9X1HZ91_9FLAO|nr:GNAT family N-acetyltransferase [Tamlana laminarinivorans]MCB4798050.1 GNAT family N-acetyltransferase [Tamlana laminarinivorans]
MEIRRAKLEDANKISYLVINTSATHNPNNYNTIQATTWQKYNTPARIKAQLQERTVFCAFINNKLVGTIGLKENWIVGFYVSHHIRGKGLGSELIHFIENYALEQNQKELFLIATPSAVAFYKSKNYSITKPVIVTLDHVDYDEFEMHKKLTKN